MRSVRELGGYAHYTVDHILGRLGIAHNLHQVTLQLQFAHHQTLDRIQFAFDDPAPGAEGATDCIRGLSFLHTGHHRGIGAFAVQEADKEVYRFGIVFIGLNNEIEVALSALSRFCVCLTGIQLIAEFLDPFV